MSPHAHHHGAGSEGKATHNMLVVGQQTVFLSHLPMFNEPGSVTPHRFQVIVEAGFTKLGSDPQRLYADDRKKNATTKIYTLNPESFVLADLVSKTLPLRKFNATLFRGHLEKGGKPLVKAIEVNVKQVIHFREFDPLATRPKNLTYLLFGKGNELFLAHLITKPPDFDQIISISTDHKFTEDDLRRGLQVVFARANSLAQRLQEAQSTSGEMAGIGTINITVNTELYLEEGELRVPAEFDTTDAERKAGFQ